jgi:arsenical pump membrane protein
MISTAAAYAIWAIAALATAGILIRPWRLPEAIWAVLGAVALVLLGLLPVGEALRAIGRGTDVYLFLAGMMLLAELARRERLFDYLAGHAARAARGSAPRLFALVYGVGVLVTVFLSNDATAVVLTPAVYAAARAAKAEPLPYLLICAFIANAASFVLPISNPANLVVFGSHMPPLLDWLGRFALPSALSIAVTYIVLRLSQSRALAAPIGREVATKPLSGGGRMTALAIAATALLLLLASGFGQPLGLPTFLAGAVAAAILLLRRREAPWALLKGISWSILPLVAGLFVLVAGLERSGVLRALGRLLAESARHSAIAAASGAGVAVALVSNLVNNLPAGLLAGAALRQEHLPPELASGVLIGIDLGPNLSVTGSLATLLWLTALRREGQEITAWDFLKLGMVVMPPALLAALLGLLPTASG